MKEAMAGLGEFQGWDPIGRDKCVSRLTAIAAKHIGRRISVILPRKHYRAVVTGRIASRIDTEYFLAFDSVVMKSILFELDVRGAGVKFIFDRHNRPDMNAVKKAPNAATRITRWNEEA
jgi:hypothetical protein